MKVVRAALCRDWSGRKAPPAIFARFTGRVTVPDRAKKAVLAGGSGFLGQALARELAGRGCDAVVLTRRPADCQLIVDESERAGRAVAWDGATVGAWAAELDGATAVVNFAGRSLNCGHTPENRREILKSRVNSVRALGGALALCARPPAVWVQCSAVGHYGHTGDAVCDETAPAGRDFMAEVCRQCEEQFAGMAAIATRKVILRLGMVLGRDGRAFPPLARAAPKMASTSAGVKSWPHSLPNCQVPTPMTEMFRPVRPRVR
jgi:hypothetical protein